MVKVYGSRYFCARFFLNDFSYNCYGGSNNTENVILDIPLPTKENIRVSYNVGDEVYSSDIIFRYGVISKKIDNERYCIKVRDIYKIFHYTELVPYNWHILHSKCRLAIKTWFLCAKRVGIYKDLRKLVGSYIWRLRNEYEWECDHKHKLKRKAHKKIKSYF